MVRRLKNQALIFVALLFIAAVTTGSPFAQQIEHFKQMPGAQQDVTAKQMGIHTTDLLFLSKRDKSGSFDYVKGSGDSSNVQLIDKLSGKFELFGNNQGAIQLFDLDPRSIIGLTNQQPSGTHILKKSICLAEYIERSGLWQTVTHKIYQFAIAIVSIGIL